MVDCSYEKEELSAYTLEGLRNERQELKAAGVDGEIKRWQSANCGGSFRFLLFECYGKPLEGFTQLSDGLTPRLCLSF